MPPEDVITTVSFKDQCAMRAMQSILNWNAERVPLLNNESYSEAVARLAYKVADAMLKARGVQVESRYGKKRS